MVDDDDDDAAVAQAMRRPHKAARRVLKIGLLPVSEHALVTITSRCSMHD